MRFEVTKKLSDAAGIKPEGVADNADPIFTWTVNWTNTFQNHKEDMIVMVNKATRFTVTIYGVKRRQFGGLAEKLMTAIRHTLLSMNLNPALVDAYLCEAGEPAFTQNHDKKAASHVTAKGRDACLIIGDLIITEGLDINYEDTFGRKVSDRINYLNCGNGDFSPYDRMTEQLAERYSLPAYSCRAFEICVTLDLKNEPAVRRLIVPADITLMKLHEVLQKAFGWENLHQFDYTVFDKAAARETGLLVLSEEAFDIDEKADLIAEHTLSEYLNENSYIIYTYDMGDGWEHRIELVREIQECESETPYLLEASGKTPPEDVGGPTGYEKFREIMLNPDNPDYIYTKRWAGFWNPELYDFDKRPRAIRV